MTTTTDRQRELLDALDAAARARADAEHTYRVALEAAAMSCGYAAAAEAAGTSRQAVRQQLLLMQSRREQAPASTRQKARGGTRAAS
jgi:hypothetical protein